MAIDEKKIEEREDWLFNLQGEALLRFCNNTMTSQERAAYAKAAADLGKAFRDLRRSRGAGQ